MKSIGLFNNKGAVGKTMLTYHLAHMLSRLGYTVLAVDLDPQSNLTSVFLDEDDLATLWHEADSPEWPVDQLALGTFPNKVTDASGTVADIALIDVGPNLGAINRAALLAADTVLTPLAADLFSLRGLHNLGPTFREWRRKWNDLVLPSIPDDISAPTADMKPIGYVIMQPVMRLDRPAQAYQRWLDRIPHGYAEAVLGNPRVDGSSYEVATLKNYQSLMPLAHDARKPMFDLKAADGALGSTGTYVRKCYQDFEQLAGKIMSRMPDVSSESSATSTD